MFIKENVKRMQNVKEVKDDSFDNQEESGYLTDEDFDVTGQNSSELETDEESSKWDHESLDDFLDIDLSVILKSDDFDDNLNNTVFSEACKDENKSDHNDSAMIEEDFRCSNSSMVCQVDLNDNDNLLVGDDFPSDLMEDHASETVKEVELEVVDSTDAMSVNECIIADLADMLDTSQSGNLDIEKDDNVFDHLEAYKDMVAIDDHLEVQEGASNYLELLNVSNFDS